MRFSTLATSLFAATLATAQTNLGQAGAYASETATGTITLTRTVERVVQTVTATRNGTEIAMTTTSFALGTPSLTVSAYGNGTGVYPTGTGVATQTPVPYVPSGAGARTGLNLVGLAAVAGLVGLVAL